MLRVWLGGETSPQHCCCEGVGVCLEKKVHLPEEITSSTGYVEIFFLLRMFLCNYVEIIVGLMESTLFSMH